MLDATVGADTMDPSTASSGRAHSLVLSRGLVRRRDEGRAPRRRSQPVRHRGRGSGSVRRSCWEALAELKKAGAEVTDVVDSGPRRPASRQLDDQFRLQVRSRRISRKVRKPAGEVACRDPGSRALSRRARSHSSGRRNAVEQRESDASRRARVKRTAIRQAVEAVLAEHRLAALVYPTLRRKPARIGDLPAIRQLSVELALGLARSRRPSGLQHRRRSGWNGPARRRVHRAGASVAWLQHRADAETATLTFQVLPTWSARSPGTPNCDNRAQRR